ncbi:glycine betaine/L-proline ABC transporter, ATP binding subunit [Campylobacter blaseri]|uniref:ABC transporter ATP-binding protein n=1 Tax=Campylobacter blaseri TaxID=2042961 RepID=UPI00139026E5|nr:ABC transporter ATP-binding protein [Campylobacter blaseri]QKF85702.1 glycine betaine/L-proline ABC transporter, ATP binding subunit [Campylobacter blaseri]
MISIEFKNVYKKFPGNDKFSVDGVSTKIEDGEFITILGSSGSGKTSLLKMINRLHDPDSGQILLFGEDISEKNAVELRRSIGYVIQQVGLFPHMTIEKNVSTLPDILKWPKDKTQARVDELLTMVGLDPKSYKSRYPAQLSGGEKQRVGLARALAVRPKIMLLDEPFGAIDAITRLNLQNEILNIHKGVKKTFLFVTHDINEAFKLGDRVMVMNQGKLLQFDTPENIVKNPENEFVKSLIYSARAQEKFWKNL